MRHCKKTTTHGVCSVFGEVFGEVFDSKLQTSHKKNLSFLEKASG